MLFGSVLFPGLVRSSTAGHDGASGVVLMQAEGDSYVYLPLVRNGTSSQQPTATLTTTPVATATATVTPSATPTATEPATTVPSTTPAATPTATSAPEVTPTPIVERCEIENGRFESVVEGEAPPWIQEGTHAGELVSADLPIGSPPSGRRAAWFGGESLSEDRLYQAIAIPDTATEVTLSFQAYVRRFYQGPTTLSVELRDTGKQVLQSIATVGVGGSTGRWFQQTHQVDVSSLAGQTVLLFFDFQTQQANDIFLDDVSFNACVP
ncbi:MAG: hypothetical protein ACE5F6_06030 [Anaerolineae bacterium]